MDLAYIKQLKLPKPVTSKKQGVVLSIDQIFHAKSNFSIVEKLNHLEVLKQALESKLYNIEKKKYKQAMIKQFKDSGLTIVVGKVEGENEEEE